MASVAGVMLTLTGMLVLVGAAVEAGQAGADTAPYELYCPGTPVGDIALNDVVTTGTISPSTPSVGSSFQLTNYQTSVALPASLAAAAAALGNTSISGTATTAVDATGATPASVQEASVSFDVAIPNPIPPSGLTLTVPSTPITVGPFTASDTTITLSEDSSASLSLEVSGAAIDLTCTAYPNDAVPTGITTTAPTASPISPVIATTSASGTTTTTSGNTSTTSTTTEAGGGATGQTPPYELYCPGTPVGNIALNDVVTEGTISPAVPVVGQQFEVTGYQTSVNLPAQIASAAQALGNTDLTGTARTTVDALGASPAAVSTSPSSFDVPIPSPVPSSGVTLTIPSPAGTVGPFTAEATTIGLQEDSNADITLEVSGNSLSLTCTAYANDSLPTGITSSSPSGSPISPALLTSTATGSGGSGPSGVSAPYELYCPGTPVGDLDFNDVTSSGSITPSSPSAGEQIRVAGYQISIPVPVGVAGAAQGLSNDEFAGLGASAVDAYGASPAQVPTGSLAFAVPIPDPVPTAGITVDMPATPMTVGPFTADGGALAIAQNQSVLVVAKLSGKAFTMNCTAYPNDSIATSGSTTTAPSTEPIRPLIASDTASGTPVSGPPAPPPNPGPGSPYELYCQGSPIGGLAINDVVTTTSITPSSLNEGDPFQLTGLQTTVTIPQSVAQEMESLGLTQLTGDLSTFLDVTGTEFGGYPYPVYGSSGTTAVTVVYSGGSTGVVGPAYPAYGYMPFSVTLPSPVPAGGVQFTASTQGKDLGGNLVAAGGPIAVSIISANLYVNAFGDQFGTYCQTLANDSVPTGISNSEPLNDLVQPTIATATATSIPPPPGPPGAYELYCPGTPVGNVVLNGVSTTGTITPADPASGSTFELTGYQTQVSVPASIVSAAAALGNTDLTGNATTTIEANGATPANITSSQMAFDVPIPAAIPPSGVTFSVPSAPASIGPFTASGGTITISQAGRIALTLLVSGTPLDLNCTSYPDNSLPSGITSGFPSSSPISPQIATTGATPTTTPDGPTTSTPSGTGQATQSTDPSTTSGGAGSGSGGASGSGGSGGGGSGGRASSPSPTGSNGAVTASSGALAFTGPGRAVQITALMGAVALVAGLLLLCAVDDPRKLFRHLLRRAGP